MSEIDQGELVSAIVSVSSVLIAVIITLAAWLRITLMRLFNEIIKNLRKDIDHCHDNLNIKIEQLDEYGQKNRQISFESRDKLANHVEKFHTK